MKLIPNFAIACLIGFAACQAPPSQNQETIKIKSSPDYLPPAFADEGRLDKITKASYVADKFFKDFAERNHYPSIAYGIIADGRLIHSGVIGEANRETKQAPTTKTLYRIASMTKSFTAMAILKLRDEGKLDLQDPAYQYIPELKDITYATADSPPVTLQHLLTMSAGFPEDNPWGDRQLDDTNEELIARVKEGISFSNAPGLSYEYSNLGFALLGNIINKVTGIPYQQYITDNILKPLGMNDSKWEYTEIPKDQIALGYHWVNEQWQEELILHDGAFGAMGGLFCSIEDFGKYVAFHLSAWPPRNDPDNGPVKRSSVREMHQVWRINNSSPGTNQYGPYDYGYAYGLGWRRDTRGIVTISHSGGLPGYGSEWKILPDYGIGIVSFSNRRYGSPGVANEHILDTLISMANLKPRTLPTSKILEKRKSDLMNILPHWSESPKLFAENFYMDKPLDLRTKEVEEIFAEAGKIKSVGLVTPLNQLRGSFLIEGEKKNIEVFFTLTPENNPLIQQLNLRLID
ncbi:MAG: beta-lactamase family protein [Cyclobacteriaceae bacterium]|nr:beta-lactamase family protein [Cyclobacteriaceae bacterium]